MSAPVEPQSGADFLARIKPSVKEERVQLCLRADLLEEWESAQKELLEATQGETASAVKRLSSGMSEDARKKAERVQQIEAQIDETTAWFLMRQMSKDKWQALCDRHPARKDNEMDRFVGYNRGAVIDEAVRMCMVDPVFTDCKTRGCEHVDCGSWQAFVELCNPTEWEELRQSVNRVNGVSEAPKSELASQVLGKADSISKPRKRGA